MNVFGDCKFRNNLETCGAGKSFEASPQAGRHTASPGSYQPLYLYTLLQTSQELRMLSSVSKVTSPYDRSSREFSNGGT